jgi:hypothetical protein
MCLRSETAHGNTRLTRQMFNEALVRQTDQLLGG